MTEGAQDGKRCTKCGEWKSRGEMTKRTDSPDGMSCWCKTCHKQVTREGRKPGRPGARKLPTRIEKTEVKKLDRILARECRGADNGKTLPGLSVAMYGSDKFQARTYEIINHLRQTEGAPYPLVCEPGTCTYYIPQTEEEYALFNVWLLKHAKTRAGSMDLADRARERQMAEPAEERGTFRAIIRGIAQKIEQARERIGVGRAS